MVDATSRIDGDNNDDEFQIRQAFHHLDESQILCCRFLKRAYILVDPQLLLLSSSRANTLQKNSSWEIVITTADDLEYQIEQALLLFMKLEGVTSPVSERLVEHGFLSLKDVNRLSVPRFIELCGISEHQAIYVLQEVAKAME
jgi:hypothetical protein